MGKCCCVQYFVPGPWSHAEEHIIIKVSPIWQRIMSLGHDIVMVLGPRLGSLVLGPRSRVLGPGSSVPGPWSLVPGPRSSVLGPRVPCLDLPVSDMSQREVNPKRTRLLVHAV